MTVLTFIAGIFVGALAAFAAFLWWVWFGE